MAVGTDRTVRVGDAVPDPGFVDQRGRPFRLASLRGSRFALSFVYTRCRDARMCPLVSAQYGMVQRDPRAARAQLVEVTLDPTFDRPAVLARYGSVFDADPNRWHLLTGDPAKVLAFAGAFGVQSFPGASSIVHTERTAVVDADGRVERFLDDAAWSAPQLAALLGTRAGAWEADWRRTGRRAALVRGTPRARWPDRRSPRRRRVSSDRIPGGCRHSRATGDAEALGAEPVSRGIASVSAMFGRATSMREPPASVRTYRTSAASAATRNIPRPFSE